MSQLLDGLNEMQLQAVTYGEGPMLVLAGAGSGKTSVLTKRIAWLIEQGVNPKSILAITFTNKAANEMKERVVELLGKDIPKNQLPQLGTFHSTCVKILRRNGKHIGIPDNFSIFDTQDTTALIKQIMIELQLSPKKINPNAIRSTISSAKNELVSAGEYSQYSRGYFQDTVARVFPMYQKLLKDNQALDFDDLLLETYNLLESSPEVLHYYQSAIEYLLVDEYQDTNRVQYLLTKLIAAERRNINVVGDAAQSIYAFRGADLRNVNQFISDYKDVKIFNLEQNYRSSKNILYAATEVIKPNSKAHPVLKLWTDKDDGHPITLYEAADATDEVGFVVQGINEGRTMGREWKDMAILYRTNFQSRSFEEGLIKANIPYQIIGGLKFYERREIKDVVSYLRLIVNPKDIISYERIVNVPPRKIGKVTFEQGGPALDSFHAMIDRFRDKAKSMTVFELLNHIIDTIGYKSYILDGTDEGQNRWENLQELLRVAQEYDDLEPEASHQAFLESVSLLEQTDVSQQEKNQSRYSSKEKELPNAVILMTLHAAKGLEFPTVFLVGLEEGLFPHSRSIDDQFGIEEERRLCYVGITRAKEKLHVSYARSRMTFGSFTANLPSRFLKDMPEDVVDFKQAPPSFDSMNRFDMLDEESEKKMDDPILGRWGV